MFLNISFASISRTASLFLLITLFSAAPHKFYVSKTFIEFNARTLGYELTCKLFTDDLEKALTALDQKPVRIGGEKEPSNANQLIEDYLQKHFKILYNNQPVQLRFIGKEVESDLTLCYFEFQHTPDYNTIAIESTIFYELFPVQQNIVDLSVNGSTKTIILTRDKISDVIYR